MTRTRPPMRTFRTGLPRDPCLASRAGRTTVSSVSAAGVRGSCDCKVIGRLAELARLKTPHRWISFARECGERLGCRDRSIDQAGYTMEERDNGHGQHRL